MTSTAETAWALPIRRRAAAAALAFASALCAPAMAAPPHPEITGMWQVEVASRSADASPPPELTPVAAAARDRRAAARAKGYVRDLQNILCLPTGFPALMQWRSPIEILAGPGRLSIVTERDPGPDEPRTVYLDQATQPAEADPSWNGHSIGRWEGAELVIDTVAFNGRETPGRTPVGPGTHVVERLSLTNGGRKLKDQMTFTDPAIYVRPYTTTLVFDRLPDKAERMEAVCEVDLEALRNLDLKALAGADPEVARMLDPATAYNAAGSQADAQSRASAPR